MQRLLIILCGLCWVTSWGQGQAAPENLAKENLVAWCVVPFDAQQRGPAARAKMLQGLGLRRCAYDWREKHVKEFEEEILQYKKHGIEFFAFWAGHEAAYALFQKYDLHPQIWRTAPSPEAESQEARVRAAADGFEPLAKRGATLGCQVGLYNHGGWGGEPENLVAVCEALRERGYDNVGIVYNWHHGHDRMEDWKAALKVMQPYLLCLNLNGMNPRAEPKILPLAQGQHEQAMLRILLESGYEGPVGILDHQSHLDTEAVLRDNLAGLDWLTKELAQPGSGGDKPAVTAISLPSR